MKASINYLHELMVLKPKIRIGTAAFPAIELIEIRDFPKISKKKDAD
jgi:hypothetical protein